MCGNSDVIVICSYDLYVVNKSIHQSKTLSIATHCVTILRVYLLYIQETILHAKEKCNCTVNKQVHTRNTRNNNYHRYVHHLELSVAGSIFYNKLPNTIKQTGNNTHFKEELKDLLLRDAIIQQKIISMKNS
jgi:hypothetical protein